MKPPAFQFYAAEYLADEHVQLMTLEEEGAYIRLLAFCWREGSIPKDSEALSRLCKGASTTVVAVVQKRFQPNSNGERLVHPRLELERKKQQEWREKSAQGGKASAHKRKKLKGASREQGGSTKGQPTATTTLPPTRLNQEPTLPLQSSSSSSSSIATTNENKEPPAFAGLMKFLSHKIGAIPNPAKEGKAIKWLIENGYDSTQCEACYEFLASQPWRAATVTWTTVKAEIGGWVSKGSPNGADQQNAGNRGPSTGDFQFKPKNIIR